MGGQVYIKKLKERNFEGRVNLLRIGKALRYGKTLVRGMNQKFMPEMQHEIFFNKGKGIENWNGECEALKGRGDGRG